MPGSYAREHFFGKYPELLDLAKNLSDEKLETMRRGGHDPEKVYAAYKAAVEHKGQPTVILAKTVKGYGLGEAGEGRMIAHNQKKMNEDELLEFRTRFGIPISDEEVGKAPFYKPSENSPEMKYMKERRAALGGPVPSRPTDHPLIEVPSFADYSKRVLRDCGKEISTTQGAVRLLSVLCRDKKVGNNIVPIVPDESRTFGMEGMFREVGIYSHVGQLYEPVDSDQTSYYKEAKDGQLLEEGITEAGAMSSFNAAGTAYSAHGINMIPFYIYYSMFGFQRVGDLIWAAADMRAKGFLLAGTAGRTSLNGEGLQHQDGHSLLNAIAFPTVRAYDPAFHFETAVIIFDGMKKLYTDGETAIYYIMVGNDPYVMPDMPEGCEEGIVKGMYKFKSLDAKGSKHHVQLFGSGAIMMSVIKAQEILAEKYNISSDLWSVTSYNELRRDADQCRRWNMLHPTETPKTSYIETVMKDSKGPVIASSDYVKALAEQVAPFVPGEMFALGTDGMGRSATRPDLRRHFEVDAECVVIATLYQLSQEGKIDASEVAKAIKDLGVNPEKTAPLYA
jgi:pyruvate dehydrogenase E1 component